MLRPAQRGRLARRRRRRTMQRRSEGQPSRRSRAAGRDQQHRRRKKKKKKKKKKRSGFNVERDDGNADKRHRDRREHERRADDRSDRYVVRVSRREAPRPPGSPTPEAPSRLRRGSCPPHLHRGERSARPPLHRVREEKLSGQDGPAAEDKQKKDRSAALGGTTTHGSLRRDIAQGTAEQCRPDAAPAVGTQDDELDPHQPRPILRVNL